MTYGNHYFGSSNGLQQPALGRGTNRLVLGHRISWLQHGRDLICTLPMATSRQLRPDYCTRFWCHDVYTGTSKPNQTLDTFFSGKLSG